MVMLFAIVAVDDEQLAAEVAQDRVVAHGHRGSDVVHDGEGRRIERRQHARVTQPEVTRDNDRARWSCRRRRRRIITTARGERKAKGSNDQREGLHHRHACLVS